MPRGDGYPREDRRFMRYWYCPLCGEVLPVGTAGTTVYTHMVFEHKLLVTTKYPNDLGWGE